MGESFSILEKNKVFRFLGFFSLAILVGASLAFRVSFAGEEKGTFNTWQSSHTSDKSPELHFVRGTLSQDNTGGWVINDTPLRFERTFRLFDPTQPKENVTLGLGSEVILMGHRVGNILVVHQGMKVNGVSLLNNLGNNEKNHPSDSNPEVGWVEGPH
jgi:hypothetical protein